MTAADDAAIARAAATILLTHGARLRELAGASAADYLLKAAAETVAKTPNNVAPQPRRIIIEPET
jgi:hypothetical protein